MSNCDKCHAPVQGVGQYEALLAFAEDIRTANYGPMLIEMRVMLQEHPGLLKFIGKLDAELRARAKAAISGKYEVNGRAFWDEPRPGL